MTTSDIKKEENVIISAQKETQTKNISGSPGQPDTKPLVNSPAVADTPNCPFCHLPRQPNYFFCPNCGSKLKQIPLSVSIGKQISIYLISIFLPPLGYIWGYRYLRQESATAKKIGLLAIVLTTLSIVLSLWATKGLIDTINQTLNKQMAPYQNLGY